MPSIASSPVQVRFSLRAGPGACAAGPSLGAGLALGEVHQYAGDVLRVFAGIESRQQGTADLRLPGHPGQVRIHLGQVAAERPGSISGHG